MVTVPTMRTKIVRVKPMAHGTRPVLRWRSGSILGRLSIVLVSSLAIMAIGCSSLGPLTLPADRFNYNKASAQSANEQMMLNIIRLRYGEPIHFLEIGSMLSQYTLQATAKWSRWANDLNVWENPALRGIYGVDGDPSDQKEWGFGLSYSDTPTITYAPLQGKAFANRVMTPIPPATIFYLSQSGWSIDRLLECCVQRFGTTRNAPIHNISEADFWSTVRFRTATSLLQEIQDAGRFQMAIEIDPEKNITYLFPPEREEGFEKEMKELSKLLGISESAKRLEIVAGGAVDGDDDLLMQTRSLLGVLNALSQTVTVPKQHRESGQVAKIGAKEDSVVTDSWLNVEFSRLPQVDAFVQVRYNGYWWFIRKTDWNSKRTFSLLTYLFSLQATDVTAAMPIVTVQAGK